MTSHLRIALVESQDLARVRTWNLPPTEYSNRASSLTLSSISFLSRIGAWPHVDASRIQAYNSMRVWDGLSSSSTISFNNPPPEPPIAHITENANLTRALLASLEALPPTSLFDKTSVANISLGPPPVSAPQATSSLDLSSYPHLVLSSGRTIAARLLVGADGLNSPVRAFAGIPSRGWDYDRHGVVATVKLAPGEYADSTLKNVTAYQRFLPSGPIALLALPGDFATLVWTATPAQAAHLKSLADLDFVAMINAAFRLEPVDINYMFTIPSGQVSELSWREKFLSPAQASASLPRPVQTAQPNSVASFPLRLRHADTYISSRVALVGDAAHTIHPLAGQGLNMGLGDVSALASAIHDTVAHGGDIGVEANLEGYQSKMYARNLRMLGIVDKLHWLYSMEGWVGVQLRGLGLGVVERFGGLKAILMKAASGEKILGY